MIFLDDKTAYHVKLTRIEIIIRQSILAWMLYTNFVKNILELLVAKQTLWIRCSLRLYEATIEIMFKNSFERVTILEMSTKTYQVLFGVDTLYVCMYIFQ